MGLDMLIGDDFAQSKGGTIAGPAIRNHLGTMARHVVVAL